MQPTRRAILMTALGAPFALMIGVAAPGLWPVGVVWIVICFVLVALDFILAAAPQSLALQVHAPDRLAVVETGALRVEAAFARRAPKVVELTVHTDERLPSAPSRQTAPLKDGRADLAFTLAPIRRGNGRVHAVWARWTGPMGLAARQRRRALDLRVAVTPDLEGVKREAIRLFSREGLHGLKAQLEAGEGAEYHALREFQPGMDVRTIDWKQSARHMELMAREYRAERNHPVVLALDCGRAMCEPIRGVARLDWALNAALLLAYVSLKMGDRAALYAFDAKPRVMSGAVSGARAFAALEALAGEIDYSSEEANYALGLFTLLGKLERRSLVVVFSEFADAISAELMIEAVQRLLTRHLVLFVVIQDEDLNALCDAEPQTPDDVSRAVIATSLLREREVVIARLRRMGVEIIDARADRIRAALLDRYLDLKRRNRL